MSESNTKPSAEHFTVEVSGPSKCKECGDLMEWIDCWNGCDEGWITDLYEQDPLWYDEDDMERCDVCNGKSGWYVCNVCHPESDNE